MPDYPNKRVVGHNGSIVGFASNITRFIDECLTVILFCNLDRIIRPDAIAKKIIDFYSPVIASFPINPAVKWTTNKVDLFKLFEIDSSPP